MAHPQTPLEDASTQTTDRNSFILVDTRDASTQTAAEEFASQENTRDSSTQTLDDSLSDLQQSPVTSETSEESRKRKISNVQEITHCTNVGKLPRTETCGMGNQFVSTHGSDVDKLPRTETCGTGDELDSSLNVLKVYSGNTRNISTQENVASNKNISQKEKAPREKSDTDVSKDTNVSSVDDIRAVPGPSGCLENKSQSKSCLEKLQNKSPLKQQPSVETEQKQPTCLVCKQTISKHVVVHDGNDMYKCCRCPYTYSTFHYLQMHNIYAKHTKPHYCDVCKMNFSEIDSHVRGGTCAACGINFGCKFQLEEHYISDHEAFLKTVCKLCKRKFDDHLTAGVVVRDKYQCCVTECERRFDRTRDLNDHLCTHSSLRLSKCKICGDHFKRLQSHRENAHPLCKTCGKRFVHRYFLNEHRSEEHKEE